MIYDIFIVVMWLYWIAVVLVLIAENREPTTTLAWILILCLLPGFGLVLYFFLGRDWEHITRKSKWLRAREGIRRPFMKSIWEIDASETASAIEEIGSTMSKEVQNSIFNQVGVPPLFARDVEIFSHGTAYFPALLEDLSKAKDTVNMMYFIWMEDELTDKIVDILLDRLKNGVEVRILNDFFGCLTYKKRGLNRLRKAGAQVHQDVTAIAKANYRNHRKITVIDGVLAHTGGFNIGQEYVDGGKKYDYFRDTGIRFRGPCVLELQDLFAQRWFDGVGEPIYSERFFPVDFVGAGDVPAQVVAHGVEDYWHAVARSYEVAISTANTSVLVQSPYYVPTDAIETALINAALAGVKVELMITGVPDKKIAWYAAFSYFEKLLHSGARVFLYEKGFFHPKTIVVDGEACSIGTMNLDVRSLDLHKELSVWFYDRGISAQYERIFADDKKECREITIEDIEEMRFFETFRNSAARLGSKLL